MISAIEIVFESALNAHLSCPLTSTDST